MLESWSCWINNQITNRLWKHWLQLLIRIEGNKIYSFIEETEKKIQIGDFTSNKKIIKVKNGVRSSEENSPYVKDKKIYSSSGELLGIIEGKEIYGAAAYLMGQFR